jgi:lipid A 3-O-deacylase
MTRYLPLATVLVLAAVLAPPARALDLGWTATVIEEDDFYTANSRDRHYTHGIRFTGTSGDVQDPVWLRPFQWLPLFPDAGQTSRRYEILGGQSMYTPEDTGRASPDPRDRPYAYAGWLYGGVGLLQDTDTRQFDRLAVTLGTIGPSSGAGQVQTKCGTR